MQLKRKRNTRPSTALTLFLLGIAVPLISADAPDSSLPAPTFDVPQPSLSQAPPIPWTKGNLYASSSYYYADYKIPRAAPPQKQAFLPGPQNCPQTGRTVCEDVDKYPVEQVFDIVSSAKADNFNFSSMFMDESEGDAEPNLNPPTPPPVYGKPKGTGYVVYQTAIHYDVPNKNVNGFIGNNYPGAGYNQNNRPPIKYGPPLKDVNNYGQAPPPTQMTQQYQPPTQQSYLQQTPQQQRQIQYPQNNQQNQNVQYPQQQPYVRETRSNGNGHGQGPRAQPSNNFGNGYARQNQGPRQAFQPNNENGGNNGYGGNNNGFNNNGGGGGNGGYGPGPTAWRPFFPDPSQARRPQPQSNSDDYVEQVRTEVPRRYKRQADEEEVNDVCRTQKQFISPKAALNDKAQWKYIVNLGERDPRLRQVIKVDVCSRPNEPCSNQISLPFGFVSRCKQKYIKKKLLALDADGQSTSTDNFFVPSCCVCEIVRGNNRA